jgi:CO/xanthine dehydrogenase Mo-binding subunit
LTTIGQAVPMIDVRERVTGSIEYVLDIELPGMLYARILRSPYPHALLTRVDASAVLDVEGVVAVLTRDDFSADPSIKPVYGPQIKDNPIVAMDKVRFVGDPVAAVAAEREAAADEALLMIEADYEELDAVFDAYEAAQRGAPLIHPMSEDWIGTSAYFDMRPQPNTNIAHRFRIRHGDVAQGFAEADIVLEETFRTPAAAHCAMEPHVCLAHFETPDRLVVYSATQTPFNTRDALAEMFGLSKENVQVIVRTVGGSYGSKTFPRVEPIAAALSRKTGRPVKLTLRRDEEFVTLNRHPVVATVKMGVRRTGGITAKQVWLYYDTGAYADTGPGVAQKGGYASVGPYKIPHVWVDSHCVYTNLPPNGAFRGYGVTQCAFASEMMMDIAAQAIGMDPVEFRLKNILHDGDHFATGELLEDVAFEECLRDAANAIHWQDGVRRDLGDGRMRGKGVCVLLKGMTTPSRSSARVEIDQNGQITVHMGTIELGQGARTIAAQIAADVLGVDYAQLKLSLPDTNSTPFDVRTTASRSTYMMGNAIRNAAGDLATKLRSHAAVFMGVQPHELELRGGLIGVSGDSGRTARLGEIVQRAEVEKLVGEGEFRNQGSLNPDTGQGVASSHWHLGAAAVEVEVDTETGKVHLTRIHAATYAGRVINRFTAELQNEGSVIMGIGSALFEEIKFDGGQVSNPNLSDYMIPSIMDLSDTLTQNLIEHEGADAHGLGETALPAIPAAVGNAVAHAIGYRVRSLPITPEKVLRAIVEKADQP